MTNKIFSYERSIVFRTIGKEYLIIKDNYSADEMKTQFLWKHVLWQWLMCLTRLRATGHTKRRGLMMPHSHGYNTWLEYNSIMIAWTRWSVMSRKSRRSSNISRKISTVCYKYRYGCLLINNCRITILTSKTLIYAKDQYNRKTWKNSATKGNCA